MSDRRHGGPYDRGRADYYYHRRRDPHMYEEGTYTSPRIALTPDTPDYDAYMQGYADAEYDGIQKEWE